MLVSILITKVPRVQGRVQIHTNLWTIVLLHVCLLVRSIFFLVGGWGVCVVFFDACVAHLCIMVSKIRIKREKVNYFLGRVRNYPPFPLDMAGNQSSFQKCTETICNGCKTAPLRHFLKRREKASAEMTENLKNLCDRMYKSPETA